MTMRPVKAKSEPFTLIRAAEVKATPPPEVGSVELSGVKPVILKRSIPSRRVRRSRPKGGKEKRLTLPPQLECSPVYGAWFRFDTTSTVAQTIVSNSALMAVPGVIGTVLNTTGATLASAIRLKKIRIWPAAGGEATVQWNGAAGKMRDESKDFSLPTGITVDHVVSLSPPAGSYASMWWEAAESKVSLLQITATSGSVIDVLLDFTLANVIANANVTFAAIAVGGLYYGYLDGNTTHQLRPLARNTTF